MRRESERTKYLKSLKCLNPEDFVNNRTKLKWTCQKCNAKGFKRAWNSVRTSLKNGVLIQCESCRRRQVSGTQKTSKQTLIDHGCINPEDYIGAHFVNLKFKCEDCKGETLRSWNSVQKSNFKGYRVVCKKCKNLNARASKKHPKDHLIDHGCLNSDEYKNIYSKLKWKCGNKKCKEIIEHRDYDTFVYKGHNLCKLCIGEVTRPEAEIVGYLYKIGVKNIRRGVRILGSGVINQPLELDIYLPDQKIGIEFHGSYYHSVYRRFNKGIEEFPRLKEIHREKRLLAEDQGIRLIQIHEYLWINKKRILKKYLRHVLNLNKKGKTVYARKCEVKEVDSSIARKFLNRYHVQGSPTNAHVHLGLFFKGELVSVTSFHKATLIKKHQGKHELIRHTTKSRYKVVGALGKATKHYLKNYHDKLYTFCDLDLYQGGSYLKAGFKFSYEGKPQYFYVWNATRFHKKSFQKPKIRDRFPQVQFEKGLSEGDMIKKLVKENYNIFKIFDSGKVCYEAKK
jgi:hypothetical protein